MANTAVLPLEQMTISQLEALNLDDLRDLTRTGDVTGYTRLKKYDLVMRLLRAVAEKQGYIFGGGILEIVQDNIGFLRSDHLLPGPEDVYVSQSQIRRFGLRTGDLVIGQVRPPKDTEKYHGLLKVEAVNGLDPEEAKKRPNFEKLTPIFPNDQLLLETRPNVISTSMIDLLSPIRVAADAVLSSARPRRAKPPYSSVSPTASRPTSRTFT